MPSRPARENSRWIIVAVPAGVVLVWVLVALITIAIRPAKKPAEGPAENAVASDSAPPRPVLAETPPAAPTPVAVEPVPSSAPPSPAANSAVGSATGVAATAVPPAAAITEVPSNASAANAAPTAAPPTTASAAKATGAPIDLLASLDLPASAITGEWRKEVGVIRNDSATAKDRAKLRLVPPPVGGYDFAVTFTAQGKRRMLAQVLSFRGRQFILALYGGQSGFASIRGQNALANETSRKKGISADAKHTSIVKVRDNEVSAYLDGELLSSFTTDFSDLDVSPAWNLGPGSTRENVLGLAVECPVIIEAITLTPVEVQPAGLAAASSSGASSTTSPAIASAASSFNRLAALISSPFSNESSAAATIAATQPAASRKRRGPAELQPLIAASQPAISDVAAALLQSGGGSPAAAAPSAVTQATSQTGTQSASQPTTQSAGLSAALSGSDAEALFRAVQLSIAPANALADPLLESQSVERTDLSLSRAEFDAEQARLAAWRTLIGRMSDFYPGAKSQSDLVKLHLAPVGGDKGEKGDGGKKGSPASFFATHANPEPLTNVTIAIETVHARTSPSPTSVEYYFIPRWPAGQKIYFPAASIPNVPSRELLEFAGPSEPGELGGMVEARVGLWSDKVMQPQQTISFDANFPNIARTQLNHGYRLVDEALRRPAASSRPAGAVAPSTRASALISGPIFPTRADLNENDPDLVRARALAGSARGLLPPQSSSTDDANALATQPQAALRELRKRQVDTFINALAVRSMRAGVWVVREPGMLAKLAKSSERDGVVSAAGKNGGRLVLSIDSRSSDGSAVSVTLTSPDQPDLRRKFNGRLQVDASANRLLLNLRATQPPPTRPPAEGDLKRVIYWNSMLLELRGNALFGIATAGLTETPTVLNVVFASPAATPSPNTDGSSPKRPRPATAKAK